MNRNLQQKTILCRLHRAAMACTVAGGLCGISDRGFAEEFSPDQIQFFEKKIRPVLAERCYECHQGHSAKSGLRLDSRAGVLRGTDYRKVVEPGQPEKSAMLFALRHMNRMGSEKVESMPAKGAALAREQVAAFEQWIRMGLPWPAEAVAEHETDPREHWSFQPIRVAEVPSPADSSRLRNEIDAFVLAELDREGMSMAPQASARTLIRRLYYDLTGLPPGFEEVEAFVSDPSPQAYEQLVDRLLDTPSYGERWGRHWLDVSRYSDTKGYEAGGRERRFVYSHAYRDWVIRAFNEDMPYDQFLLYQLAADQLVDFKGENKGHLAAMGYLTLGRRSNRQEDIDDLLDVTFRGTMALTVSCARCHDHKTDPISTEEYYSLASIFMNSEEPRDPPVIGEAEDSEAYRTYQAELAKKQKVVDDFLNPKLAELAKKHPNIANRRFQLIAKLDRADRRQLQNLQRVVDKFVADAGMEPDRALILVDKAKPVPGRILIRGQLSRPGKQVEPGFLKIVAGDKAAKFTRGSGRLEMAQAIVEKGNPLTSRTIVNRVWMHHFGAGLVSTPSDFGLMGEKPSHPELLDWLANWFIDNGWSIKKLHKLIVMSSAYRMDSVNPRGAEFVERDPANRKLWRMNRRRLDFESMRDSILFAAGRLDGEMFGRSVNITKQPFTLRRTLYSYIDRQNLDPIFGTFDFASPLKHSSKRPYTTIPPQSLFMLNSPFMTEQAARLAERVLSDPANTSPERRITGLYQAALARDPSTEELAVAVDFLRQQSEMSAGWENSQTLTDWMYGWGFFDNEAGETFFEPFTVWDAKAIRWQPAAEVPDRKKGFGYVSLHRSGGHPSNQFERSAVARWVAREDMSVDLVGTMERPSDKGDGVGLVIVHSGDGIMHRLDITSPGKRAIEFRGIKVKAGQSIDLIVNAIGNSSFDSFSWNLDIRRSDGGGKGWHYTDDFGGPGQIATPLANLAQALLCSNEFLFVD